MLKRLLIVMMLVVSLLVVDKAYSANPLNRSNSSYDYGTYWRMDSGTYNYDVVFYENASDPDHTMAGRFPFTLTGGTVISTKEDFINIIIIPAMNAFNNLIPGLSFNYDGSYSTSSDANAYRVSDADNTSEIEVYWNDAFSYASWDQLSNRSEFGMRYAPNPNINLLHNVYIVRHEMLHCLGFSHKVENYYGFGNSNWYPSSTDDGNFSDRAPFSTIATGLIDPALYWKGCEDTLHGLNIVYNTGGEDLKIEGYVTNFYSDGYAEAYLADSVTAKILYQSPIDKTGKFEFRVKPRPSNPVRIVVCDSHINKDYSIVGGTDGKDYICKLDHTSNDDTKPITGANWSTYWALRVIDDNEFSWKTGKNYKKMLSNLRFQYTGNLPIPQGVSYYNVGNISMDRTESDPRSIQILSGIQMLYP